jgi:hypothetical protein
MNVHIYLFTAAAAIELAVSRASASWITPDAKKVISVYITFFFVSSYQNILLILFGNKKSKTKLK